MNPFAALSVSDDEDEKFTRAPGAEQKPPKKSTHRATQPTRSASRSRRPRSVRPKTPPVSQPPPRRSSPKGPRRTPERRGTTKSCLPRKCQPPATTWTAAAAPGDQTDPARRAEDTAAWATCTTSCRRTSTSRRARRTPREPSTRRSRSSPRSQRASPWTSTTAAEASRSTAWLRARRP